MTSFQCTNIQGNFETAQINQSLNDDCGSTNDERRESADADKVEAEFHLAQETFGGTPRSNRSKSSSEVFSSSIPKKKQGLRPASAKRASPKPPPRPNNIQALSSIPLPVKSIGPIKTPPLIKDVKSNSRTSSTVPSRGTSNVAHKHTLEIQFINKNKRFIQMKKDMWEKQRPVLDLYQGLVQIKKKLEELGKTVKLEDIKLLSYAEEQKKLQDDGSGEQVSMEVVAGMKNSIEEIPKTLMDICKNLLSRRALIVELLESVTKSEVDVSEVSDKIESLKNEGQQLQHSLDAVITEHQAKINVLVTNWQKLLNDRQSSNNDEKIEELESKLGHQEQLVQESNTIAHEMYRKMEERKSMYDRSMAELNEVIQSLKERINNLEKELDDEKKTTVDFKTRNNTNSQNVKTMRAKITELESEKASIETTSSEMQKKIRLLQDQLKHKEVNWNREREELNKNLKHQENLLQKLTAEKNQFETRFTSIKKEKKSVESTLQSTINSLNDELNDVNGQLEDMSGQRDAALERCGEFESYIVKMKSECKETMNRVSCSIEWGKDGSVSPATESYIEDIAKDLRIRELQDRIHFLEKERDENTQEYLSIEPSKAVLLSTPTQNSINKYQLMLRESENMLQEKSTEIESLRSQIRQLKVRQVALEEQNIECPSSELQLMVEEGQRKLHGLMKRSMESEHTVEKYVDVIERQALQMNEMKNLLRYRENMANVLKASRDELLQEKESLIKYSHEIKSVLAEVSNQGKIKECLARELGEKIYRRENEIVELKGYVQKLEAQLLINNEKRFKLQESIQILQNRLEHREQLPTLESWYNNKLKKDNQSPQSSTHDCTSLIPVRSQDRLSLDRDEKKPSCCKKCSSRIRNHTLLPSKLRKKSNHKNLNFSLYRDSVSDHSNCHHKANSRSLIGLSLQTVDFLKTRLNFLTSVNMMLPENSDGAAPVARRGRVSKENVDKILKLSAKRYKYLQDQANESYGDLTRLVKLAVTQQGEVKK